MAVKNENIFAQAAAKRKVEQRTLEEQLTGANHVVDSKSEDTAKSIDAIGASNRKVPMNISLPADFKRRLIDYANSKHISASIVIQLWIDEYCK